MKSGMRDGVAFSGSGVGRAGRRRTTRKSSARGRADFRLVARAVCGRLAAWAGTGLRSGGRRLLAAVGGLLAAARARMLREPGGGRPITVVDQASAGAKLRLVLVEVDGQRVLVAASGDQVPAMLALASAAPAVGGRQTAKPRSAKPRSAKPRSAKPQTGHAAREAKPSARESMLDWSEPGVALPAMARCRTESGKAESGWAARAAAGSEIQ